MFNGPKMARILGQYNIDMDEFVVLYDKLPRRLDLWKAPDEYEAAAIEAFLEHQDLGELCKDLDVTQQYAFKVITRYLVWIAGQDDEEEEEELENGASVLNGTSPHHDEGAPVSV